MIDTEQKEIWAIVNGYPNYSISSFGRIKNRSGKILKIDFSRPYPAIELYQNNKPKRFTIHRLVATAFLENTENKKTVNHIDGVKTNNNVSNLEWNTYSENLKHAFLVGLNKPRLGEKNKITKYSNSFCENVLAEFNLGKTQKDIAESYLMPLSSVKTIFRRYKNKHKW